MFLSTSINPRFQTEFTFSSSGIKCLFSQKEYIKYLPIVCFKLFSPFMSSISIIVTLSIENELLAVLIGSVSMSCRAMEPSEFSTTNINGHAVPHINHRTGHLIFIYKKEKQNETRHSYMFSFLSLHQSASNPQRPGNWNATGYCLQFFAPMYFISFAAANQKLQT